MAGVGSRFVKGGFVSPKPLIMVDGRMIIEYVLSAFDANNDEFVFICNEQHLQNTMMRNILKQLVTNCEIVSIPPHKLGPVYTILAAYHLIVDEYPVLVCYCDTAFSWNVDLFRKYVCDHNLDGCVLTHTGFHPHTLSQTKMAFVKTSKNFPLIDHIQEKQSYTQEPMQEHASSGAYYFKTGSLLKKYFDAAITQHISHQGEYYVTLVYNLLINEGMRIGYYDTHLVAALGTPEEVLNYQSWMNIIRGGQIKTQKDVIDCYNYWLHNSQLFTTFK